MTILTNNPLPGTDKAIRAQCRVDFHAVTLPALFDLARDRVHMGCRLLSHPLSGSIKPNETPYKSILISDERGDLCLDSLALIEQAQALCRHLCQNPRPCSQEQKEDFRMLDMTLLLSALESCAPAYNPVF